MKDRTLRDQRLGVCVTLGSIGDEGKWVVRVCYRTKFLAWYVAEQFSTPPMRTVNALQVLRATFEMHRMRKAAHAPTT